MARRKNSKNLTTAFHRGGTLLGLGATEIWDGADLVLLRETISKLYQRQRCRRIDLDMRHVQYVPSGFFGMLCDWHDRGVNIRVISPTARVQQMLWFTSCFRQIDDDSHELSLDHSLKFEADAAPFSPLDDLTPCVANNG
jgi:hypothetical protein